MMATNPRQGSAEYFQELFCQVLVSPSNFLKCKKTWRYASSMGRSDVLAVLLSYSPEKDVVSHAHYWACEEVKKMLECQLDAWTLHENSYNGQLVENFTRRI